MVYKGFFVLFRNKFVCFGKGSKHRNKPKNIFLVSCSKSRNNRNISSFFRFEDILVLDTGEKYTDGFFDDEEQFTANKYSVIIKQDCRLMKKNVKSNIS
jgi:hypothetical protein